MSYVTENQKDEVGNLTINNTRYVAYKSPEDPYEFTLVEINSAFELVDPVLDAIVVEDHTWSQALRVNVYSSLDDDPSAKPLATFITSRDDLTGEVMKRFEQILNK